MSALPPIADIQGEVVECLLLTHSGHCLVLGVRPEYFTLSGVGLPLGHEAFGFGAFPVRLTSDSARRTSGGICNDLRQTHSMTILPSIPKRACSKTVHSRS